MAQEELLPQYTEEQEQAAAIPQPVNPNHFNPNASLPYGFTVDQLRQAMEGFVDFLGFINGQLVSQGIERMESMMMPASFSSMVGEFMNSNIPKYCPTLAKNTYHNGHPDLVPAGMFPGDSVQHHTEGIEVKGSRYSSGWQGHNAEDCWLMVFVYESNRPVDPGKGIAPFPFRFIGVVGAQLTQDDWQFAGRSETSRRTITAAVKPSGKAKMVANWLYAIPGSFRV